MLTPLTNIKIWHDQVSQAMIYDVMLYRVRFTLKINLEDSTAVIDIQIFQHRFIDTFDIIQCHIHVTLNYVHVFTPLEGLNWQHITIIGHSMLYQEIGISRCFPDCLISFGSWRLHVVWLANVCRISWMGEMIGPWHINSWQPRTWALECRGRCTRMVRGRRCWKAVAGTPPLSPLPAQVPAPWLLPASSRSGSSSCFHLQTTNYYIYGTYKISSHLIVWTVSPFLFSS